MIKFFKKNIERRIAIKNKYTQNVDKKYYSSFQYLCVNHFMNHNRIVLGEMSSWTALTWYIGLKTAF